MVKLNVWQIDSTNPSVTEQIGEQLGKRLRGGEVIELVSDLGGGKTTFVRGLARGIGSADHVSSPTFTLSNIYHGSHLHLQHFDFYRLPEAGIIANELEEAIDEPYSVLVIEWANIIHDVLPTDRLTITFTPTATDGRHLRLSYPAAYNYLTKGLVA